MATTREHLHRLVDALAATDLEEAAQVLRALVAGEDDGPLTAEEEAASEEGWRAYLRGEGKTLDEVRRGLAKK